MIPSWPYIEYGSKATSGITIISGQAVLIAMMARCISPLGFQASFPVLSLSDSSTFTYMFTARMPKANISFTSSTVKSIDRRKIPGMEEISD
jgi:hypothetical protein